MNVKDNLIDYFDSFGLDCPEEIILVSDKLNVDYIYNSTQFEELMSVLCDYHCLYYINESNKKKSFYDMKVFSHNGTLFNETFIMKYFT